MFRRSSRRYALFGLRLIKAAGVVLRLLGWGRTYYAAAWGSLPPLDAVVRWKEQDSAPPPFTLAYPPRDISKSDTLSRTGRNPVLQEFCSTYTRDARTRAVCGEATAPPRHDHNDEKRP